MAGNRIAIIDDQESVRRALGEVLEVYGYEVILFESAEAFLAALEQASFGCVVSDVRMPGLDGIALVRAIMQRNDLPVPAILISGQADVPMAVAALKAGAADFIEKPVDDVRMVAAINRALARPAPPPPHEVADTVARFDRLTTRERDVFDLVAAGHTSQAIARQLGISVRTVEGYRAQIMEKLQVASVSAIVRMAIRLGRMAP